MHDKEFRPFHRVEFPDQMFVCGPSGATLVVFLHVRTDLVAGDAHRA